MWQKKNRKRKGFTLVELLVVIMILGLLAGLAAPKLFNQIGKSKVDLAKPEMKTIETAIDMYLLNTGYYPDMLEDLIVCPSGLDDVWAGPYLDEESLYDPWDNFYQYYPSGSDYDLYSFGADGSDGGEGENADIYN